ncbi:MAG: tetratricopeptide repeat protein [Deltaproteobacteria bacterium]|jgi:tetratricopeptide (TPR) repeat protein|nr:tetratricopeptide repeat protein [Deltaproteobacteria bacterium]MBK8696032.1 tetratricopeptide repeat protein [Deltaproteobacteria bacterium]MBP6829211.1 tetratricopeptide repeat protein [Deltaproteobacteria bacterium]
MKMLAAAAATKVAEWVSELTAVPAPSTARLTVILDDITGSMKNIPVEQRAACYDLKGIALALLGQESDSLGAHLNACRLDKNQFRFALNMAVTYRRFGRETESLNLHAKVLEMDNGYNATTLGSLAHSLANIGEIEEARKALDEAFRVCTGKDPNELRNLALWSANVGLNSECVELLARSLRCFRNVPRGTTPALEVLHEHMDVLATWFVWDYRLALAVAQVATWQGKFPELTALTADLPRVIKDPDPAWGEVFASTRGSRSRANAAAAEEYLE